MKVSERISTMVHAFDDTGRKDEVRRLAEHVALLEAVVQKARGLRWVHPNDRARYEAEFDAAVAALDAKETK
jgi:hypothetical protein